MEKAYAAWRAFQDRLLTHVTAAVLIGCTLLALLEVFRRYMIGTSFEWQQDAVTFGILSAVFLYFGISQRHNEHLSVTVIPETLEHFGGPRNLLIAEVIRLLARSIALVFMLLVSWWGIPEVREAIHYETRTESLVFPMWPFLAALLVGFLFMAVTLVFQVWFGIQKLRGRAVPDEESHGQAAAD